MINKNAYRSCLPPNVMKSLVSYGKGMGINDLLRNFTGLSTNSEEDVEIDLVCDTSGDPTYTEYLLQKKKCREISYPTFLIPD